MDADMAADPDERRFDEGISLIKAGKIEEAIEIFSELVEKDATNHKAWNAYGVALSQTIHTESAIHCFENALQLDPGNKIYERNLKRVKSPPPKKVPRKMAELTPHKKSRKWIGGLCILFIFIGLCALLFSGVVPGFSVSDKNLGLFPQPTPTPEIIISTPTPVSTATTPPPTPSPTPVPTPPPKPETLFHFIDVGQGDAALIQSQGKNMLIDAGPKSAGQRLVEYLKRHNVTTLDYVVASHPYEDHIGGMLDVIRAFTVKNYVDNGLSDSSDLYTDVINAVISDQAVRMIVTAGMSIPFTKPRP
jgi:tetratricopeptide (TPR) repeat protein